MKPAIEDHLKLSDAISLIRLPAANAKQPGRPKKIPQTGMSMHTGRTSVNPGMIASDLNGSEITR